jgi:hypothetical protein
MYCFVEFCLHRGAVQKCLCNVLSSLLLLLRLDVDIRVYLNSMQHPVSYTQSLIRPSNIGTRHCFVSMICNGNRYFQVWKHTPPRETPQRARWCCAYSLSCAFAEAWQRPMSCLDESPQPEILSRKQCCLTLAIEWDATEVPFPSLYTVCFKSRLHAYDWVYDLHAHSVGSSHYLSNTNWNCPHLRTHDVAQKVKWSRANLYSKSYVWTPLSRSVSWQRERKDERKKERKEGNGWAPSPPTRECLQIWLVRGLLLLLLVVFFEWLEEETGAFKEARGCLLCSQEYTWDCFWLFD